jgi:molecular chaperone DnaK (HSP70)
LQVPFYFTDLQRTQLIVAADWAGLSCVRILNESTAVALAYGIYQVDLPNKGEKPRLVFFLDVGHSATQAYVVAYDKGGLKVSI